MLTVRLVSVLFFAASMPAAFAVQDPETEVPVAHARSAPSLPAAQLPPAPTSNAPGQVEVIYSNIAASPTSNVPGVAGAKFTANATSTAIFDRPWLSPNGSHWTITADTDLPVAEDEVLILDGVVAVREGTPAPFAAGQTWGPIDSRNGVNDAGELAVTTNVAPDAATDDYTVKITAGPTYTVFSQQGQPIAALAGTFWANSADSAVLLNDGRISVSDDVITGAVTTTDDEIVVLDNVILAREGVTVPGNQLVAPPQAFENFSIDDTYISTGGTHVMILGDLLGATTTDQVLVYDGNVVLQEGAIIPGSGMVSPIALTAIRWAVMDSAGGWIARGENVDGVDWIVRNGVVVLTNGSPVVATAEEILMTATINGAQETPPSGSAATGTGVFLVNTDSNTIRYNITLTGVVGETMAHIHGFAPPGTPAGILYALPLGNAKTGTITYVEAEEAGILGGQTYVNIHTGAFPGGEIRGQVVTGIEEWTDIPALADTFFAVASNQAGDYVVMGVTNAPAEVNGVLVMNSQKVIARENDPIDFDGNGMFDDDVFINTFGNDDIMIADDRTVYYTATLRNGAATGIGSGFFRLHVGGVHPAYCFGDGSGTACPCGNTAAAGSGTGCLSSLGVGGRLDASGNASIAADTVVLSGSQMPNSSVLYFQGTTQVGGGMGAVFGDGLRCVAGMVVRLKTVTNVGGASQYPDAGSPSVSVRGMIVSPGVRTYQAWYRNAAAFCTPSTFNLTNAVEITWGA